MYDVSAQGVDERIISYISSSSSSSSSSSIIIIILIVPDPLPAF